jgi:Xaa-Pro aminopeptidase
VRNGYHIDETRMFALGSMPEPALTACRVAIDIHRELLERVRPGVILGDLFEHSVQLAQSYGYGPQYLGPAAAKVSFVGHGIGLELIEPPFIARGKTEPLAPGMTFALEPKFCFQNAFAAGIESVFVVTETGSRLISRVPVDVFICGN